MINKENKDDKYTYTETEVIRTDIVNSILSNTYVTTSLEDKKSLHNTYYFEEIYFEENQEIKEGENILKYTNGEYFVSPYNCVITEISIPSEGEMCTNNHYLVLQSTDTLQCTTSVEEDELDTVYIGQEASIEIESLNKIVTGYVTKISNDANYSSSGSTFDVTVEFQNDGEILLGMSASCEIILEKAENVIAIPKEAVNEEMERKYVTLKQENGEIMEVEIETGIENEAYVEITNGLMEGQIVIIEESNDQEQTNRMTQRGSFPEAGGDFTMPEGEEFDFSNMPEPMEMQRPGN